MKGGKAITNHFCQPINFAVVQPDIGVLIESGIQLLAGQAVGQCLPKNGDYLGGSLVIRRIVGLHLLDDGLTRFRDEPGLYVG